MGIRDTTGRALLGGTVESLEERVGTQSNEIQIIRESMTRLEQLLYSTEWRKTVAQFENEFSIDGLKTIIRLARMMRLKNPIIKRSVEIQRLYVWAQGVTLEAKDPQLKEVVQDFLGDERNRAELTSHQARSDKETELQNDGNLFFRFFVNPETGTVRVRTVDPLEVKDILTNPDDAKEPWYYRRVYTRVDLEGKQKAVEELIPDWRFNPRDRAKHPSSVQWTSPIYHVAVNKAGRWGVPENYAGLDWALSYKTFLEQLSAVWKALARYAWNLSTKGGKTGVTAAKAKLGTTQTEINSEGNPPALTGSTWIQSEGVNLTPMRTAGTTLSAEDGRRLFLMSIAAAGFPETFYGDVSVGTLATAESLDRPTELKIKDRQMLWSDIFRDILSYVLLWSVKASKGPLRGVGKVITIEDGEERIERVEWPEEVESSLDIEFPPIINIDTSGYIAALSQATTLGGFAPAGTLDLETFTRQAAIALGFVDVDSMIEQLFPKDEEGNPLPPDQEAEGVIEVVHAFTKELKGALNGNTT